MQMAGSADWKDAIAETSDRPAYGLRFGLGKVWREGGLHAGCFTISSFSDGVVKVGGALVVVQ